ncbi:MAG: hypothetical protein U5L09_17310 [Bacteroidales bacterium]|nr:hypothetical protein [Bacteroidales bacterium]
MKHTMLLMLIVLSTVPAVAKWYTNYQYNFKIDVPASWSFNQFVEGTDHVYDFLSPDEQVAIQIRAFKSEPGFTDDLIMGVVEEGILSQGATKLTASDDQVNGYHGKLAAYKNTYNGMEVGIVIFTTLQQDAGYAFIVVVPSDVFQQKTAETDAILNTFTLLQQHKPLSKRPAQAKEQNRPGKAWRRQSGWQYGIGSNTFTKRFCGACKYFPGHFCQTCSFRYQRSCT